MIYNLFFISEDEKEMPEKTPAEKFIEEIEEIIKKNKDDYQPDSPEFEHWKPKQK